MCYVIDLMLDCGSLISHCLTGDGGGYHREGASSRGVQRIMGDYLSYVTDLILDCGCLISCYLTGLCDVIVML